MIDEHLARELTCTIHAKLRDLNAAVAQAEQQGLSINLTIKHSWSGSTYGPKPGGERQFVHADCNIAIPPERMEDTHE